MGGLDPTEYDLDETLASSDSTDEEIELADWRLEESLPEKIVFETAERLSVDELGQRSVTRLDQGGISQWSAPILFFPDGSTSAASLLLKNDKQLYRRATLRALTGVGRTSDLLTREEVDRYRSR